MKREDSHARVHRPWGCYQVIDGGHEFQVKRIVVHPNGQLSLQKHRHRAEHWVVVNGRAKVTVGNVVRVLCPNEHVHIPLGAIHRLENPGNRSSSSRSRAETRDAYEIDLTLEDLPPLRHMGQRIGVQSTGLPRNGVVLAWRI
jgi:mannose-6-phosphate isomerase-like protein (cupin superfamily)